MVSRLPLAKSILLTMAVDGGVQEKKSSCCAPSASLRMENCSSSLNRTWCRYRAPPRVSAGQSPSSCWSTSTLAGGVLEMLRDSVLYRMAAIPSALLYSATWVYCSSSPARDSLLNRPFPLHSIVSGAGTRNVSPSLARVLRPSRIRLSASSSALLRDSQLEIAECKHIECMQNVHLIQSMNKR